MRQGLLSALALSSLLGALFTTLLTAGAQTELRLGGARVLIPSGDVVMSAREAAIVSATELCRAESRFDDGASCTLERFASELPYRAAHVAAFFIDRTEVTRGDYRHCVSRGICAPSSEAERGERVDEGGDRLPVVGVDLHRAERYCAFVGGRLPTEEEWARAARGDDERTFPWGDLWDPGLANHGRPPALPDATDGFLRAAPVGSFPGAASPFGVLDLAGNVWEWTSSLPAEDDLSLLGGPVTAASYRVLRGGSFLQPAHALRVTARNFAGPVDLATNDLGFRCAYELP